MKVLISTSSFAKYSNKPLELLKEKGFEIRLNPYGRKLNKEELIELGSECEYILAGTEDYSKEVLEKLPKLKGISRCGVGLDSIDLEEAKQRGIKIERTPDAPTQAVAELTLGIMIDLLRKISTQNEMVKNEKWKKYMGSLLSKKTIGIVGLGRIGRRVAEILLSVGSEVIAADPYIDNEWVSKHKIDVITLEELVEKSDIITLHINMNKENYHMFGEQIISKMKNGSYLINTSRGGLVDEGALYKALKEKHLSGAALDVMEEEPYNGKLRELDNIILTPHIGGYAVESRINMELEAAQNLIKIYLEERK